MLSQISVPEAETEFVSLSDGMKHGFIFGREEIEAAIATPIISDGTADHVDVSDTIGGIVHGRKELDVPSVASIHDFRKVRETVDGLPHRGRLIFPGPVTMFHPSVVSEGRDVIAVGLDTKNDAELIVQLDAVLAHVMAKAVPLNSCRELAAKFPFESWIQTAPEKHGQLIRFHSVGERADQFFVNGGEGLSVLEDDIRGVFGLHETPMNAGGEDPDGGTVFLHHTIQGLMQLLGVETVGQHLGLFEVLNVHEGVFNLLKVDAFFRKLDGEMIVRVAIELQPERGPGGHPQIAESEVLIDKIEVVVETAAGIILEKGLMGGLVMPGLVSRACLHRRKDVDQPRMISPFLEDFLNPILFAERVDLADEFDGKTVVVSQSLHVLTDLIPVRGRPLLIIEDSNIVPIEEACHCLGMADVWQSSLYNNSVIAGKYAGNVLCVTFHERYSHGYLLRLGILRLDDTHNSPEWPMAA